MKAFLITVDTEGDNLWGWHTGDKIQTENVKYINRFQELCEKYGLIPSYLTNYEMAMDQRWVSYGKEKAKKGLCEIGMHIHAWNSPPQFDLEDKYGGNAYITEYPYDTIDEKIRFLIDLLSEKFETPIWSSRSGRWATNNHYFEILVKNGIHFDCSVTPQIDLSHIPGCSCNCGNDYRNAPWSVYQPVEGLLEIPMTTRKIHRIEKGSIKHKLKTLLLGAEMWLRPFRKSYEDLVLLTKNVEKNSNDYLEFMIHSSELMPNGSPYFKDEESIDILYKIMDQYFSYIANAGYQGMSLSAFGNSYISFGKANQR